MAVNKLFSIGATILDTHPKRKKRFRQKRRGAKFLTEKEEKNSKPVDPEPSIHDSSG